MEKRIDAYIEVLSQDLENAETERADLATRVMELEAENKRLTEAVRIHSNEQWYAATRAAARLTAGG